jgi:uncharacterized protein (TIGR02147 family)
VDHSIFEFKNYKEYLGWIRRKPLTLSKRPLTYGLWAKRLGYRSPRIVGMVFKGKRLPSFEMVEKLGKVLSLSRSELRYFHLLVSLERSKDRGKDFRPILEDLEELNPTMRERFDVDVESFNIIADWYNFVIHQLVSTNGFKNDPRWISLQLRKKISEVQVAKAIENLLRVNLIKISEDSKSLEITHQNFVGPQKDIPSAALKLYHAQMLDRAKEALVEQDVSNREFSATALVFDKDRLQEAKIAIRSFRDSFDKKFTTPGARSVYQFNVQLFEHTQSKKEKGK